MTGIEQEILCGDLPKICNLALIQRLQKNNIYLNDTDKEYTDIKDIDILIGSDYLGSILDNVIVHITDNLIAVKTKLGWTLQGPMEMSYGVYNNVINSNLITTLPHVENEIEFLWNLESLGIKDPYNNEISNIPLDIAVNEEGRYEVNLIWKDGPQLGNNYDQAKKRLWSTTKKLEKMKMLEGYHNVFKDWEKEGIITEVHNDNTDDGHYMPHHAVIKLESTTTKIRPVFDASCKDENNRSLNSCIEKGGNLIELIPKLLMLFRVGKYGVISDIRKAFLQISISPEDRKYLKLLWWKNPEEKNDIVTYQHARVPFGVTCSPYLLAATIKYHLEKYTNLYTKTAKRLKESFYVDNCVTSLDSEEEVKEFIKESIDLMEQGKFDLRGWMTNLVNKNEETNTVSVLGLQWERNTDELRCNLKLKTVVNKITKRVLLSITQQIFDPIGILCPTTLVPKLIIQKVWSLSTGWDEEIPKHLETEYKEWLNTVSHIEKCKIARRISDFPLYECNTTVHVFCDASKEAYAGCVFIRTEYKGTVTVQLILAKSRVAPIKRQMSLPRLELMGALIASRLYHEVNTSGFLATCREYSVYCWTDSAVVLAWVQRQHTWKAFVTNRVKEICINTKRSDWFHLPGKYNPADLCSRGCNAKTLLETQWWTGPQWLYDEKEKWPRSTIDYTGNEEEIINSEQKKNILVTVEICTEVFSNRLLYFNQYSKIVRLVARPRRINTECIGFEEYKSAEKTLIKLIQRESLIDKVTTGKKLIIIKEEGICKVKTRLDLTLCRI
ncbi:hypothetical protein K1T71_003442 [Dendrolimus kikuchii]|uniref:Uncharacterized protein n=1 Tax=Dendrolimus kikuchii TaxID=765133 RepID=A0ACC1DD54_9NEOP|nr:hypothetical protein K1T71_003442 [Dendrolimus kikuchii]